MALQDQVLSDLVWHPFLLQKTRVLPSSFQSKLYGFCIITVINSNWEQTIILYHVSHDKGKINPKTSKYRDKIKAHILKPFCHSRDPFLGSSCMEQWFPLSSLSPRCPLPLPHIISSGLLPFSWFQCSSSAHPLPHPCQDEHPVFTTQWWNPASPNGTVKPQADERQGCIPITGRKPSCSAWNELDAAVWSGASIGEALRWHDALDFHCTVGNTHNVESFSLTVRWKLPAASCRNALAQKSWVCFMTVSLFRHQIHKVAQQLPAAARQ